ncbi:MAG: hypothetical protein R2844_07055 [Caldilineales bacterium]
MSLCDDLTLLQPDDLIDVRHGSALVGDDQHRAAGHEPGQALPSALRSARRDGSSPRRGSALARPEIVRAMASRWRSPPLSFNPFSPIIVS